MVAWAKQLGLNEAADLLQQTLDEEKANDGLLNELAERVLNPQASAEGSDEDGEGIDTGDEPKGTSTKKRAKK
jgi:hypothetical protein